MKGRVLAKLEWWGGDVHTKDRFALGTTQHNFKPQHPFWMCVAWEGVRGADWERVTAEQFNGAELGGQITKES